MPRAPVFSTGPADNCLSPPSPWVTPRPDSMDVRSLELLPLPPLQQRNPRKANMKTLTKVSAAPQTRGLDLSTAQQQISELTSRKEWSTGASLATRADVCQVAFGLIVIAFSNARLDGKKCKRHSGNYSAFYPFMDLTKINSHTVQPSGGEPNHDGRAPRSFTGARRTETGLGGDTKDTFVAMGIRAASSRINITDNAHCSVINSVLCCGCSRP